MTQSLEYRKIEFGSDISQIAAGEVIVFEFQDEEYKTRARKQLVTEKTSTEIKSLYRPLVKETTLSKGRIILGRMICVENKLIHEGAEIIFRKDSSDIANQRIAQALDQLLNEHGITE